ncbi:hypothetical protein P2318_25955 [Myxococcaceae bacterium GXIMD 01537]
MKKLTAVLVLGSALLAAAPRTEEPTDAEVEARVEARQREVLARLLEAQRAGARPAAHAR